jgi:hypothetical protein
MSRTRCPRLALLMVFVLLELSANAACDETRKQECDKLLGVMKPLEPLDKRAPSADTVDAVIQQVGALKLQDQPLGMYAKNYKQTLTVLSATLKLKAGNSAPDGTDDVIKKNLQEAHTDHDDVQRYCAQ